MFLTRQTAPITVPAHISVLSRVRVYSSGNVLHQEKPMFPSVRRLLIEYNLDPSLLTPTGPEKRLLKGDVLSYISLQRLTPFKASQSIAQPQAPASPTIPAATKPSIPPQPSIPSPPSSPAPPSSPSPQKSTQPFKPITPSSIPSINATSTSTDTFSDHPASTMRQVIAKRLTESKINTPHTYMTIDVILDDLVEARKKVNSHTENKVSINDFIIKATASSLRDVPAVNVVLNPATLEITSLSSIDISVAVAIPGGLITPVVFGADQKSIIEINQLLKVLADKARKGTLLPNEYLGGSVTISNLGMFGISQFTAVINPPQPVILSVGGVASKLVVDETTDGNNFKTKSITTLTLNFDERVVSAELAAHFLKTLQKYLEKPQALI